MKKILLLLAMLLVAATAWSLPFVPTTDPSSSTTKWYQIKNEDLYLYANFTSANPYLSVSTTPSTDDFHLWCFVGTESTGYKIYNRGIQAYSRQKRVNGTGTEGDINYVEWDSGDIFYMYYFSGEQKYYITMTSNGYGVSTIPRVSYTAIECDLSSHSAFPYNTLTPYNYRIPYNALSDTGEEGYAKLLDQDKGTQWRVENNNNLWLPIWLDFESDVPFYPFSYTLTTGRDIEQHSEFNPKEWYIYGKANKNDPWMPLAIVTDGTQAGLGTQDTTDYTFISDSHKGFRYFRFVVNQLNGQTANDKYIFELAELQFKGMIVENPAPAFTPEVPFEPTPNPTVSTTQWYQIKTDDNRFLYYDWSRSCVMASSSPSTEDNYLWCFVGNDSIGYTIYNRARQRYLAHGDLTDYFTSTIIDYVEWGSDNNFYIYSLNPDIQYVYYASGSATAAVGSMSIRSRFTAVEVEATPLVTTPYNTLAPYNYNIPHNAEDNLGEFGYAQLFDRTMNKEWFVKNNSGSWETVWVDFASDVWFIPNGYILTTGSGTQTHPNRNPKEWVLYGKTFQDDEWTKLAHVTDGEQAGLGTASTTDYSFDITGATEGYRYFRFEVRQINGADANGNYTLQLTELRLLGTYVDPPKPPIPGDVTGDGSVDVSDVNAIINMILGKATQTDAGDITGDGNVDVSDVNAVINIILGKTTPVTPPVVDPTPQSLTATGYNTPHNTLDATGDEGYAKLVDGDRTTKWCVENRSGSWETIWIDLKSNVAFKPTSYIMTTGNDTHLCPTRNPKNWKIYGRNSESESWTELVHVTDGGGLAATNTTDYSFQFNGITKAYQYYRFEVLEVVGADQFESNYYAFQLAELTLVGVPQ